MRIKLADLLPNPHRDIETYPIHKEKVAALQGSIQDTGFWETIVVRKSPTHRGKFEIAFGHHRMVAALGDAFIKPRKLNVRGVCKPSDTLDLPCKPLDEAFMLRMMAAENLTDWDHDFRLMLETVRAVIAAAERGEIGPEEGLEEPASNARGGIPTGTGHPGPGLVTQVTPRSVAVFLGSAWLQSKGKQAADRIQLAFRAERLIRSGHLKSKALDDVTVFADAEAIVATADSVREHWKQVADAADEKAKKAKDKKERDAAAKAKKAAEKKAQEEAKRAADVTGKNIDKGKGRDEAREKGEGTSTSPARPRSPLPQPPEISDLARKLASTVDTWFSARGPHNGAVKKLLQIAEHSEHMTDGARKRIVSSLNHLSDRVLSISRAISEVAYVERDDLATLGWKTPEIKKLEDHRLEDTNA